MPYKDKTKQAASARRHYLRNKGRMKERAITHTVSLRQRLRTLIRESKDVPCADCGVAFPGEPYVMDFDHVRGEKVSNVGAMVAGSYSVSKVRAEIAKCDVVCANCHRRRTYVRSQALVG